MPPGIFFSFYFFNRFCRLTRGTKLSVFCANLQWVWLGWIVSTRISNQCVRRESEGVRVRERGSLFGNIRLSVRGGEEEYI